MSKTKPTPKRACNCLKKVGEAMEKQYGYTLDTGFAFNFAAGRASVVGPFLKVHWADDKPRRGKKLPSIMCSYCPFCGKKK